PSTAGERPNGQEPSTLAQRWKKLLVLWGGPASLEALVEQRETVLNELADLEKTWPATPSRPSLADLARAVRETKAADLLERCQQLADRAAKLAAEMDFTFLYNEQRHLFAVGYNQALGRLDNAHYDLLASEACLTSFLAVARGEVPRRHWFQLGR